MSSLLVVDFVELELLDIEVLLGRVQHVLVQCAHCLKRALVVVEARWRLVPLAHDRFLTAKLYFC